MKEIKSVVEIEKEKGVEILPDNKSIDIKQVIPLSAKPTPTIIKDGEW